MKKLFTLFTMAQLSSLGSMAGIILEEPVVTQNGVFISGYHADYNYRYTISSDEWGTEVPKFLLTLEPYDMASEVTPCIPVEDMVDPNFWTMVIKKASQLYAGKTLTAQQVIRQINIHQVALFKNIFYDYEALERVTISADGKYFIPDGCFSECLNLQYVEDNVAVAVEEVEPPVEDPVQEPSGEGENLEVQNPAAAPRSSGLTPNLSLGDHIVPANVYFTVMTKHEDVWGAYKAAKGAFFSININEMQIDNASLAFAGFPTLVYGAVMPSLAERSLGEIAKLAVQLNTITVRLPENKNPKCIQWVYAIAESGQGVVDYQSIELTKFVNTADGRRYFEENTDNILGELTDGQEYMLIFYWRVVDADGNEINYDDNNNKFRVYFTFKGDMPEISNVVLRLAEGEIDIPEKEFEPMYLKFPVKELTLRGFSAEVAGNPSEVKMVYEINTYEQSKDLYAENETTSWVAESDINLLEDLEPGVQYRMRFFFHATNKYGKAVYNNDGQHYKIYFTIDPSVTGIEKGVGNVKVDGKWTTLDGRMLDSAPKEKGVYIHKGKKYVVK